MLYLLRQLILACFILCSFPRPNHAQDLNESDVSLLMKKARADAEKMTLPVNKYNEEALKAAEETSRRFLSPEFQERVQCEQRRLEEEVFGQYTAPWKRKTQQAAAEQASPQGSLTAGEKVFLFISSSVPDDTVHAYIAGLDKAADPNVSLVMRGMVGGMSIARAHKGQSYFSRILKKDLDCLRTETPCERYKVPIHLQPSLFTRYGITRVPAVVYEHDGNAFLIQGDASLDFLLEQINREAKSTGITKLIKKIRGTL
ncbi:MAG: TrbC family F-type conjugative pilus assembly protein [Desulforhopalus sp.]